MLPVCARRTKDAVPDYCFCATLVAFTAYLWALRDATQYLHNHRHTAVIEAYMERAKLSLAAPAHSGACRGLTDALSRHGRNITE